MKKLVKEEIYTKKFEYGEEIRYSDLPKIIKEDDIIEINHEEIFYSENEMHEGFTELIIIRERQETDEEYENRLKREKQNRKLLKERRYQQYLKLKKEFEND